MVRESGDEERSILRWARFARGGSNSVSQVCAQWGTKNDKPKTVREMEG